MEGVEESELGKRKRVNLDSWANEYCNAWDSAKLDKLIWLRIRFCNVDEKNGMDYSTWHFMRGGFPMDRIPENPNYFIHFGGFERMSKHGECAPHCHLLVEYRGIGQWQNHKKTVEFAKWKDDMYQKCREILGLSDYEEPIKNNRTMCCKVETIGRELVKYAFKTCGLHDGIPYWGVIPEDIRDEVKSAASDQFKADFEREEKRAKRAKDGWYNVMVEVWEQTNTPLVPELLLEQCLRHAANEEKLFSKQKLYEIVELYMLVKGKTNPRDLAKSILEKYGK